MVAMRSLTAPGDSLGGPKARRAACMQVSKNTMEALLPLADRSRRGPARTRVYTTLRDAIVSAQLAPGRQISENELAALLGVSRTPIREALQRLREERLVAIVPQLGTFVTHIRDRKSTRLNSSHQII